jgi:hypothetical protein
MTCGRMQPASSCGPGAALVSAARRKVERMLAVFMIVVLALEDSDDSSGLLEWVAGIYCAGLGALARCDGMEWRFLFALIPTRSVDTAHGSPRV